MNDEVLDRVEEEEESQLSRRGLLVKGGLAAAGLTMLGSPAAAAFGATKAGSIKVAVVTHGDTGSFWSVFKKGVDQAAKDLKSRGVSVTQVYANNNVAQQVAGINAAIGAGVVLGEELFALPFLVQDLHEPLRDARRGLERVGQPLRDPFLHHDAIDADVDRVLLLLVELRRIG